MKRLFSLLLACMILFLTACNGTPPNNSQSQDSELKDTIIMDKFNWFIETPSRILFSKSVVFGYTYYYSKVDGKAYLYCFDPVCDHSGGKCLANPWDKGETIPEFPFHCTYFINNRFYTATVYGQIYSFAFDGSDLKIEYGPTSFTQEELNTQQFNWSPQFGVYDKYIYILMNADENGNPRTLRFNTETKEMEDLTEKAGNAIFVYFFYNEEIYGLNAKLRTWIKADLELKKMEPIEALPISMHFFGSVFYNTAYDDPTDYKNRKTIGIQAHDMKTGKTVIFSNEMLGVSTGYNYSVMAVDKNYIYFTQNTETSTLVGTITGSNGTVRKVYTWDTGKLYRMKHDGTECTLIYDNPNFEFPSEALISGDKIILEGNEFSFKDGNVVYNECMKVGTIGPDGKIEKFENIELVY